MSATIDFAGEAKKNMSAIPMKPVQIDPQLRRIEAEGGTPLPVLHARHSDGKARSGALLRGG